MRKVKILVALVVLSSCSDDPSGVTDCVPNLVIAVSSATIPEVSWTPTDCRVNEIYVLQAGMARWLMSSTSLDNHIQSPVHYGEPARQGTVVTAASPLTPGIPYTVRLWRVEDNQSVLAGEHQFVYRLSSFRR